MLTGAAAKLKKVFWLLPGFFLWTAYPPMGEGVNVYFALAPLMWLSRQKPPRLSARTWFVNGFFFWTATLAWMPAIIKNGGPWPLVVLGWGGLSVYCALYFGVYGWLSSGLWRFVRGRSYLWRLFALVVAEPLLWAGLEIVRSRFGGGFAWNQLGVAPVNMGFGAPASIGGVYLVSASVVLVNGTLASIAERMLEPWLAARRRAATRIAVLGGGTVHVENGPEPPPGRDGADGPEAPAGAMPRWARSVETAIPFALIWALYSFSQNAVVDKCRAETLGTAKTLPVALVQRDFPCVFKAKTERMIDVYEELAGSVARFSPSLVVLAESAFSEGGMLFGDERDDRPARFADLLCRWTGARGVLGGGSREDEAGRLYNSAALFTASGQDPAAQEPRPMELQIYDKVHLVPFGEYIPGDKTVTALQKLAPVGSCTPGELKLLDFEGVKLGVAICYEDTDSAQMRELAAMGAQALVFITNDSWFSESVEAVQHAWQSVARAAETGLAVVRVGNSGVSGTITPWSGPAWLVGGDGRPLVDKKAAMFDNLPYFSQSRHRTPYVALGDAPIFVSFLLLIGAMVMVKYRHHHEKRR